jgi:hypothetical protein
MVAQARADGQDAEATLRAAALGYGAAVRAAEPSPPE